MKKKFLSVVSLIVSMLVLVSCQSYKSEDIAVESTNAAAKPGDFADYEYASGINTTTTSYSGTSEDFKDVYIQQEAEVVDEAGVYDAVSESSAQRKIVYNSSYTIQSKQYDRSVEILYEMCEKHGAYFETANTYGGEDGSARSSKYKVRVPVEAYDAFISEAGSIGVVTRSSQNNSDVTEQYYDTQARLESAKIREERVLVILENASKLDDVLALERELADIRYEIESMTGSLRKLDSLVSYATVTINLNEVTEYVQPKAQVLSFTERLRKSFEGGIDNFKCGVQELIITVAYNFTGILIWVVIIVVLAVLLKVIVRKKRKAAVKANGRAEKEICAEQAEDKDKTE